MELDNSKLDDAIRTSISAIRYALACTASELKGLKTVRHTFDPYAAEQYARLKRRATLLQIALRTNRLSLNKGPNINHQAHCSAIRLDGPWFGERHQPTNLVTYRPRVRPSRTQEPDRRKVPPTTQPAMLGLTKSIIVNWTRMVNNWALCCGFKGRVFHLDMSVTVLMRRHDINRRQRERALKELSKTTRDAALNN